MEQFVTESLQPGNQILLNELNKLTQAVAKIEHCEETYLKFQDVIKFDVSKDVFYFSSLWKGDPPMTPINIGYSECAQDLKQAILKFIENHKKFVLLKLLKKGFKTCGLLFLRRTLYSVSRTQWGLWQTGFAV